MSKTLVLKALSLLQEENKDKSQKDDSKSLTRKHKRKKTVKALYGAATPYASVDKTAKNLEVLKRLKELRPKSSVAQKVIHFYTNQNKPEDDVAEAKPQHSILFDDDADEEIIKRKKTKRKQEEDDDDF